MTSECDSTTCDNHVALTISIILSVAFAAVLGYYFPIKDSSGGENRIISLLLSVLCFPVYVIILSLQYPFIDRSGISRQGLTVIASLFFWPFVFIVIYFQYWYKTRVDDSYKFTSNEVEI
jgi:hypothetical protein